VTVDRAESHLIVISFSFKKLLDAPLELLKSIRDIQNFLATRKGMLPLINELRYWKISMPTL